MSVLAKQPGFTSSGNARLSALRVNGEKQFLEIVSRAIRINHGIVKNAAEALKVHRNTLMKWIDHYHELGVAVEDARIEYADKQKLAREGE
jgi:transcriptional regulator with PAS, ATPase and Fis domain